MRHATMNPAELTRSLKMEATRLGFAGVGFCPAVTPTGLERLTEWLACGYAGEMTYFERRRAAYEHPSNIMLDVRSIVMLATSYQTIAPQAPRNGQGRVSSYAWSGGDYHDLLHDRTSELGLFVQRELSPVRFRAVVDTAPLLEREFAQLAGLGWQGKNTLLLNKSLGSWFFLSALFLDIALEYDQPFAANHCGTCTACLDACPTHAFVQPAVLNATRCISYLTIEHRSQIPRELREPMGDWVFGCDVCQDVCPWNRKTSPTNDANFQPLPEFNPLDLPDLFWLDDVEFRHRFRLTPLWRPRRRGILRNAAIVLGNQRAAAAIPALHKGLHDAEPIVRGACAWALGQIGTELAAKYLSERLELETDPAVITEITQASFLLATDASASNS